MSYLRKPLRGFTLIELLIVVAIIAILAAIAVPNFIEAQIRAKVSRCKADFRTLAVALESFRVDHSVYPPYWSPSGFYSAIQDIQDPIWTPKNFSSSQWPHIPKASLTSPIAYIQSPLADPFLPSGMYVDSNGRRNIPLQYGTDENAKYAWIIESVGPDADPSPNDGHLSLDKPRAGSDAADSFKNLLKSVGMQKTKELFLVGDAAQGWPGSYDSTNGSKSNGDIVLSNQ